MVSATARHHLRSTLVALQQDVTIIWVTDACGRESTAMPIARWGSGVWVRAPGASVDRAAGVETSLGPMPGDGEETPWFRNAFPERAGTGAATLSIGVG